MIISPSRREGTGANWSRRFVCARTEKGGLNYSTLPEQPTQAARDAHPTFPTNADGLEKS